jgi:hypothetical protein
LLKTDLKESVYDTVVSHIKEQMMTDISASLKPMNEE